MSHRLQILLDYKEFSLLKRTASVDKKSVSEWVRNLIRTRLALKKLADPEGSIETLRRLELPSPSIDQMLKEIEGGRL